MRFLVTYKPDPKAAPSPDNMAAMGKLIERETKSGALVLTGGLGPSPNNARVQLAGGKISVIDGPFAESKELIGGFAVIQANSRDEAIEMTKNFLHIAGDGVSDMHVIMEAPQLQ